MKNCHTSKSLYRFYRGYQRGSHFFKKEGNFMLQKATGI